VRSAPISRPTKATAKVLAALLSKLPARVLAVVKWELQPTGRLDYRPARIDMALGSSWQVYRLRSCAKEPETVAWLEREFQATDCLYDIGANVGAYSLVAFAATAGSGTIVAFEPGFTTYAELCRNIALNHAEDAILALPIALSAVNGVSTFGYSDTAPGAARHEWGDGSHDEPLELKLRSGTFKLDDLIESLQLPHPNLIKLDVDGPELEVLTGASRTLRDPRLRSCLVELDDALETSRSARELLEAAGFTETSRHPRGGGSGGTLFNVIFSRT
jgi:FkbM family methyltransferase